MEAFQNIYGQRFPGPSFKISDSTSASITVNGLIQGIYTFELTVTDDKGATGKDTVEVKVNPTTSTSSTTNTAPTADAGPDKTITLPTNSILLSGSGTDVDGSITTFSWTKISGPSTFSIVNSSSAVVNIQELIAGIYLFELKVIDDKGDAGRDTVQVKVNPASNIEPTAHAGLDKSIKLPTNSVSFSGSGSDADGTITGYQWTKISGPSAFTIENPTMLLRTYPGLLRGNYQFELEVTDDKGGIGRDTVELM